MLPANEDSGYPFRMKPGAQENSRYSDSLQSVFRFPQTLSKSGNNLLAAGNTIHLTIQDKTEQPFKEFV